MAAFDYARSRATADKLLTRFGQVGAIRRTTAGAGEPWNPGPGVTSDTPCKLVVDSYSERERDGELIKQTDRLAYVSAEGLAIEPKTSDKLVIGGVAHEIVTIDPVSPAGIVVLYEMQVRR